MSQVSLALKPADFGALDAVGLRIPGLRQTGHLHDRSTIEAPCSVIATVVSGARIEIGAFGNISGGTINNARFGRYASVATGVVVGPHEHPTDWLTTSRTAYYPEVNGWDRLMAGERTEHVHARKRRFTASCPMTDIGPDVWLGQGCFIKAGTKIGAGAIIGARATVLRDIPPYAVVVGTPGRVVRLRFKESLVERLLKVQWWRYSVYDLFDAPMDNVEAALDVIEDLEARGAITPYAGRMVTPTDLTDAAALAAELAPAPMARAS